MENTSMASAVLRDLLRRRLTEMMLTYSDLSRELDVSLPTIKRWMTKDEIPFNKLVKILEALKLNLKDIDDSLSFKNIHPRPIPSAKDELFISKHPREAFVLLLISLGFDFEEIQIDLKVSKLDLEKIFLKLDRNGLVEFTDNKRFRSLIRPPLKWAPDGPFVKTYMTLFLKNILEEAQASHEKRKTSGPEVAMHRFAETYMSRELELKFRVAIEDCIHQHLEMARIEKRHIRPSELLPLGFHVFISKFSPWKNIMWKDL
ncbi:MAG: helix-turn-helix domain-containing protein [Bdellovibrionaceae bacterium]|nr:helix-turn-helix domain-containing protein [Pseudobdellovibrionaceae bacterium]